MAQTIWKGWLSFGLVSIPVRLYRAVEEKTVRFREIDRGSGRPVRHRRVVEPDMAPREEPEAVVGSLRSSEGGSDAADAAPEQSVPRPGDDLSYQQVVKGYELASGEMVTVDREELAAIAPEQTRTIEVVEFVELAEIDPIFFDRSYHVVPQNEPQAHRAYDLLLHAMEKAGRVAIGTFVLRTREHLAAIRPTRGALCLVTLHYADEIRSPGDVGYEPLSDAPPTREVRLAEQLIGALSTDWDPDRHRDAYRDRVLRLLEERARQGDVLPAPPKGAAAEEPVDLMAALRASVEAIEGKSAQRSRRKTG